MPADISGSGAAGGIPLSPTTPVRPASPSRALAPVERPGPRTAAESPLARSGVALEDLLFAPDLLATRDAVAPVAMELGLETARRQLLQRRPADALVTLDTVWSGAEGSEEGWYLRAAALTLLGHPHEGERMAADGLALQPQSLALRLLQSVARAMTGDLSGARAALYPALEQAPRHPVLLAQQAIVLARQGHADDAVELLDVLAEQDAAHPALLWARGAVRLATSDRTRSAARPAVEVDDVGASQANASEDIHAATGGRGPAVDDGDVVSVPFRRLGAAMRTHSDESLLHATQTLLRACSSGGALAAACAPAESHAARQVLSSVLVALRGAPSVEAMLEPTATPVTAVVTQLLPLLRTERHVGTASATADAERVLRRLAPTVPPAVRHILTLLIEAEVADTDGVASRFVSAEQEQGPIVPVRLGLSLLSETAATRAIERRQEPVDETAGSVSTAGTAGAAGSAAAGAVYVPSQLVGGADGNSDVPGTATGEFRAAGWGAADHATVAGGQRAEPGRPSGVLSGAAFPVVLLVAGAVGAAANGAPVAAALLAGACVLLVLRGVGRSSGPQP